MWVANNRHFGGGMRMDISSDNDKLAFILYSMDTYEDALKTMELWALNF